MKKRTLEAAIKKAQKFFPAVVVTGPRQSGKTTLLKSLFSSTHQFFSLEDPDVRIGAKTDPRSFLEQIKLPVIIDEIQYVPELLSYIKTAIDKKRKPGQWLLTGSQNFVLMHGISQSLAGRAAVLSLLPFSYAERIGSGKSALDPSSWIKILSKTNSKITFHPNLAEILLRGDYPEIASKKTVDRQLWCGSYISTYLERDVRNLAQIGDLNQFERFLMLCAARTGQLLNLSEMSKEIGISVPTAKRWLSILEASYQVYLLYPYYQNIGKRIIKSPKLYFNDTALVTYLLGIHNKETLLKSPNFGSIFETFIVTDFLKRFLHAGQRPTMYYLRTRDGLEIDLVIELGQKLYLFEIKATTTLFPRHATSLLRALRDLKTAQKPGIIISQAKNAVNFLKNICNINWLNSLKK